MALVVLLRGVNVGGHRRFRPAQLVKDLAHLDMVNIGAAGTFVVRGRVSQQALRDQLTDALPFETEIMICPGREVAALVGQDWFARYPPVRALVPFGTLLARKPKALPALPLQLPDTGPWLARVLAVEGRWVIGVHRREIRAIGQLGKLDRIFGSPATTRSWTTVDAIARAVEGDPARR